VLEPRKQQQASGKGGCNNRNSQHWRMTGHLVPIANDMLPAR
jgi:hypothetical protein